jgi:hypothetical protein
MASDSREARIVRSLLAKYPDSAPTEQDRKEWREQGEKRRKKEGIHPRKASNAMGIIRGLEQALKMIHHARFDMLTSMMSEDDVKEMEGIVEKIDEESEKLLGVCQQEMECTASRR